MNNCITEDELKTILKNELSKKRYNHSLSVATTAEQLAIKWGASPKKAYIAGLVHDCTKEISLLESMEILKNNKITPNRVARLTLNNPKLIHAITGAIMVRKRFRITDPEIIDAVRYHTTAKENMSLLTKIVFAADATELSRRYPSVNTARNLTFQNLDKALIFMLSRTITELIVRSSVVHPNTFGARNYLLLNNLR